MRSLHDSCCGYGSMRLVRLGRSVFAAVMLLVACVFGGGRLALAQTLPDDLGNGTIYLTGLSYYPQSIQLSWNNVGFDDTTPPSTNPDTDTSLPTSVGLGTNWLVLNRTPGALTIGTDTMPHVDSCLPDDTITSYNDTSWSLNTRYTYYLSGVRERWDWVAGTGEEAGHWSLVGEVVNGPNAYVTVEKAAVSANQTIDTRIDPRFDVPPLKNFPFANSKFRGGLFSGYNEDNAQVARTYLKFTGLPGPTVTGDLLWPVANLMVYSTRLAKTGTASLICRSATSTTWDASTLTWDTAPTPMTGASSGGGVASISWDITKPVEQWVAFDASAGINSALAATTHDLTLVLQAHDESGSGTATTASAGWAYFARDSYTEPAAPAGTSTPTYSLPSATTFYPGDGHGHDLSAFLLYAFGGSDAVSNGIFFDPDPVVGGGGGSATVYLLTPAPSGGLTLSLTSADPTVTVPATVTVAPYASSANFYFGTTAVSARKDIIVTASTSTIHIQGLIEVDPSDDDDDDDDEDGE